MKWTLVVRAGFRKDENSPYGDRLKAILMKLGFTPAPSSLKRTAQYWTRSDIATDEAVGVIKELLESPTRQKRPVERMRTLTIQASPTGTPPPRTGAFALEQLSSWPRSRTTQVQQPRAITASCSCLEDSLVEPSVHDRQVRSTIGNTLI